jgi:hypothetical protein
MWEHHNTCYFPLLKEYLSMDCGQFLAEEEMENHHKFKAAVAKIRVKYAKTFCKLAKR